MKATTRPTISAENLSIAFDRMDTNKDGVLTFEEYIKGMKNSPGPGTASEFEQRFNHFDKDGNGTLTREEFTTGTSCVAPSALITLSGQRSFDLSVCRLSTGSRRTVRVGCVDWVPKPHTLLR